MSEVDHRGFSERQHRELAAVEAEVSQLAGGQLVHDVYVLEGTDPIRDRPFRIYAAWIATSPDAPKSEHFRGSSEASPADALRMALRNYKNAQLQSG